LGRNKNIIKSSIDSKISEAKPDIATGKFISIIQPVIWAVLGITAVLMVLNSTSRYGVGMSPDAVNYISTAKHLLEGKGYTDYLGEPYVHWGPLLPSLLALIGLAGIEPFVAVRFVNALCFGIIVFCSGILFTKRIKEWPLVLLGVFTVSTSFVLLFVSVYAWTEPLFNILIILFVLNFAKFLKSGGTRSLILAGVCSALACLQRYVGLTTVIAGNIFILLFMQNFPPLDKLKRSALFSTIACVPVGIWVIRNKLVASTLAEFHPDFDISASAEFTRTLKFITPWFVPTNIPLWARLVIIGTFIFLLVTAVILKRIICGKKQQENAILVKIIALFVLIYVTFTMTASILVNAEANDRLFSPIYVFLILLILVGLEAAAELFALLFKKRWAGYSIAITAYSLWLAFYIFPGITRRLALYEEYGAGPNSLNSAKWHQSPLINWLKEHPPKGKIFSNEPFAIYVICGFEARLSPRHGDMENFKRQMSSEQPNYLVWFNKHWRKYLYNLEELNSQFKLIPLETLPDGAVFIME
jgi:hypothetical protein